MKKLFIKATVLIGITFGTITTQAQDGQALFKSKCNTCHLLDKASTGPMLKGVKQKWTDAGEAEMLYQWVQNSTGLIGTGKSKMANEIKGFSPMEMPAQQVTNEEIDAILSYVDNPPAPPVTATTTTSDKSVPVEVKMKPNYKENLSTFYLLIGTIAGLLITIIILSQSILNLVKSDYFKNRLAVKKDKEDNGGLTSSVLSILLIVGTIMLSNSSFALTFSTPGESTEPTPWLKVENSDLYSLVVINIILLGIIVYLKSMFNKLVALVKTEKQKEKEVVAAPLKKINQVLTDVVPIEEEHKILLDHEYDGIRELDNNLPPWWVWGFFATIVFAIIYLFNYHIFETGDLQYKAYEKEMKKADAEVKAYLSKMAMNVDETNVTLLTEGGEIAKGKALFDANCVACHNSKGEGNIGPNLTDKNWIYGFDIKEVFKTIKLGTANGMPEHNSKFNPIQLQQVASYVLNLSETKGKAPQGDIVKK
ncbi:MAG: cbb3-type cytochrome c oxidase N-terminal domain-containing protein [Crocinitomicaceae bacterium]|jgi:cytochrome c oxidase cbb3-type subunit 3